MDKSKKMDLRQGLRRRVGAYKRYPNFVCMLESDFKCIFSRVQIELGLKEYNINEIINSASDKQIKKMCDDLSEYQLSKRFGW